MPTIVLVTEVSAPQHRCFDLARSIDFHMDSMKHTGERAIAGTTTGLISLHDEVTWEARHVFFRQRLTSRITAFDAPRSFTDEMVKGAFHSFRHEHHFDALSATTTRVTDTFTYRSPLGPLGHLADALFVTRHMRSLLRNHQRNLKAALESDHWRAFILNSAP